MQTVSLTDSTFSSTVERDGIVLVDFWAPWCGPCRQFKPVFERSATAHPDVVHATLNVEEHQQVAAELGVVSIPTLMAFRDGILVFRQAGALPPAALTEVVEAVEGLDMEEVRAKIAAHQAEHHAGERAETVAS